MERALVSPDARVQASSQLIRAPASQRHFPEESFGSRAHHICIILGGLESS